MESRAVVQVGRQLTGIQGKARTDHTTRNNGDLSGETGAKPRAGRHPGSVRANWV